MNYYQWSEDQEYPSDVQQKMLGIMRVISKTADREMLSRGAEAKPMDLGAQVAGRRNLEFSAGQRSHRLSMGSYTKA